MARPIPRIGVQLPGITDVPDHLTCSHDYEPGCLNHGSFRNYKILLFFDVRKKFIAHCRVDFVIAERASDGFGHAETEIWWGNLKTRFRS